MHVSGCKHLPLHAHVCVHAVTAASVARFHVCILIGDKRHFGGANLPGTFKISSQYTILKQKKTTFEV